MAYLDEEFLLQTDFASRLYHNYAEGLPLIDYHCHVSPAEIARDRHFTNMTEVWLEGDHYKWRMIRSNGVPEEEVTGNAPARVKFQRFAEALPLAVGNPMAHWTALELKRYFNCDLPLNGETAQAIWDRGLEVLPDLGVRRIIEMSRVEMIGTTDDPTDDLAFHEEIAKDGAVKAKVLPSFRPDKAIHIHKAGFKEYVKKLGEAAGMEIRGVRDVAEALDKQLDYFVAHGCRAADLGLDKAVYREGTEKEADALFARAMAGEKIGEEEAAVYQTAILSHVGRSLARRGIVMQVHFGVQRNPNTRLFQSFGPDAGCDCIAGVPCGIAITAFLDRLERDGGLPRTILYSLSPADNALLDSVIGAFQGPECPGKIQHGAAWWFNDTKGGMEDHLKSLASLSLLGNFVGMLTDSRSFLSYTRHEYFRRILCNFLGEMVRRGEAPADEKALGEIVRRISYANAKAYFGL